MSFTEEDAGYVTVRPVVKQTFRISELADMVVNVTGKNILRVEQIFRAGTVVYNGYRYWWGGFNSNENELAGLLSHFPDDDPSRLFNPAEITAISLEIGGGTQRTLERIAKREASAKRTFSKRSPWENFLQVAQDSTPRYEKYSYTDRADVYRVHLSAEKAALLMKDAAKTSPRALRSRLAALQPPAALLLFSRRTNSSAAGGTS